jgi:hypothetical protein
VRPGSFYKPAILLLSLAANAPAAADPVSFADLHLLVEGGVGEAAILRHLERWGLERDLRAADLVALRRAGAGDSLLAALAAVPGLGTPEERREPLAGGRGVLLTNLDEEGRRLGGEAPPAVRGTGEREEARVEAIDAPPADVCCAMEPLEEEPLEERGSWRRGRERDGRRDWDARLGTPGGYTRYKLYYSSRPDDGFRTWVLPTYWLARPAAPFLPPAVITYFPPYLIF